MKSDEFRRLRRGTLDMTQDQLAIALGVSARTVYALERAKDEVDLHYALAIKHLANQASQSAE